MEMRIVRVLVVIAGLVPSAALADSKVFNGPTQHNTPIDVCLGPGGPCGPAPAPAVCKGKGFKLAAKFALGTSPAKTVYLGTTQACNRRDCQPLARVACSDTLNLDATTSSDWGSVN